MIDGDGFAHATYHWENVTRCAQPYGHLSKTAQLAMPPNWGATPREYAVEFTVGQCSSWGMLKAEEGFWEWLATSGTPAAP